MVRRHGFSTALAVLFQVHGRVVVQEDPVAVEEAMAKESVESEWCTDSRKAQEEPHQKRQKEEQRQRHQDVQQEVHLGPSAQNRPSVRQVEGTVLSQSELAVQLDDHLPHKKEKSKEELDYAERMGHPEEEKQKAQEGRQVSLICLSHPRRPEYSTLVDQNWTLRIGERKASQQIPASPYLSSST